MIKRRYSSSGVRSRAPSLNNSGNFTLGLTDFRDTVISPGSSSDFTDGDSNYHQETGATYDRVKDVIIPFSSPGTFTTTPPVYASNDNTILRVDNAGRVTRISDGTTTVRVGNQFLKKTIEVTVVRNTGVATVFMGFEEDSLAQHCSDAVDTRISGADPVTQMPMYTEKDHSTPSYTRNTDFWASDLPDITSISPWNSFDANKRGGVLITSKHMILAEHFPLPADALVRFIDNDNNIVTRTVIASYPVGPSNSVDLFKTDMTICELDDDLPPAFGHAQFLPANWVDYLPGIANGIPTLSLNQDQNGAVFHLITMNIGVSVAMPLENPDRLEFSQAVRVGDSGQPSFLIINNRLVLVTTWTDFGGGPNFSAYLPQIADILAIASPGYVPDIADLSGFPDYS